jgi:hypothetical protein
MATLRRGGSRPPDGDEDKLPLRWAFILLASGLGAVTAGHFGGTSAALIAGVSILGVLGAIVR